MMRATSAAAHTMRVRLTMRGRWYACALRLLRAGAVVADEVHGSMLQPSGAMRLGHLS